MNSPVTGQAMREINYEGATVFHCEQTGGEFVTADALAHIVQTRDETFCEELVKQIESQDPSFGVPAEARGRELACPRCGTPMEVINYAGDTSVIIDRCSDCGSVWLDHHELEQIQAILEHWEDVADDKMQSIQGELNQARQKVDDRLSNAFTGSRFSFVNRLINKIVCGETFAGD